MRVTVEALDRATGRILALLPDVHLEAEPHDSPWRLGKRVAPEFVARGSLTAAQAACALYRFDA